MSIATSWGQLVLTFRVLWAFSFWYRDLMHPSQFTVLVQMHGVVMFAWVGLLLTQADWQCAGVPTSTSD